MGQHGLDLEAGQAARSDCGDIGASACNTCVATGFQDTQQFCAFAKDAAVYYDSCLLCFSNTNFIATADNDVVMILMNTKNFTGNADSMRLMLFTLLNDTTQQAAGSSTRFTTARLDISLLPTMYCLVQCMPDLAAGEYAACLRDFLQLTLRYLDGKQGGRLIGVRCNMRYEIYPFYNGDPMLRIISRAPAVPAINSTPPGTPITVFPQPPLPPASVPAGPAQEHRDREGEIERGGRARLSASSREGCAAVVSSSSNSGEHERERRASGVEVGGSPEAGVWGMEAGGSHSREACSRRGGRWLAATGGALAAVRVGARASGGGAQAGSAGQRTGGLCAAARRLGPMTARVQAREGSSQQVEAPLPRPAGYSARREPGAAVGAEAAA
ncbi:cysteine-rich receptor-like protein kinase 6 [Panicum virgatum]|uniref:cysteine-rich receptor-like protein kinase 6 n=1 Tax=Panicum virgatum TaxID=38727 RepID=UPI0019D55BBC|nr:cysteine-rich receptor-like protein kinase 6 [Panicum virgatum]